MSGHFRTTLGALTNHIYLSIDVLKLVILASILGQEL